MTHILEFRDTLKRLYAQYEMFVLALFKFVLVLICMLLVKKHIGYMDKLQTTSVIFAVSFLSAFLPFGLVILILAIIILANIYALSMPLAGVVLGIMLVMFILYYRFTPKEAITVVMVPMMFYLKIPYIIPIVVGLVATPIAIVAVAFGTITYYMIYIISINAAIINNMETDTPLKQINYYVSMLVENKEMYYIIGIFTVIILIVYLIKRMKVNNAWTTAIIVGGSFELVGFIVLGMMMNSQSSVVSVVIGTIVAIVLSIIIQFFIFSLDYSRTEHTQFEDDDYYYYVKAVPKINVTAPQINVKRINAKREKKVKEKTKEKSKEKRK